jgi:hypothetical protein
MSEEEKTGAYFGQDSATTHTDTYFINVLHNARNINLEVPLYLLKEKQGYTVRKI